MSGYNNDTNSTLGMNNVDKVDNNYFVEQNVFRSVNCLLLVIFGLCIVNHRQAQEYGNKISNSRRLFHWFCLICTILNIVKSVDEQNILGIYPENGVLLITNNVTVQLMNCGALIIYSTLDMQFSFNRQSFPKSVRFVMFLWSIVNFLVFNSLTLIGITLRNSFFIALLYYYMLISFLCLISVANYQVYQIRRLIRSIGSVPNFHLKQLYIFIFACNVLVLLVCSQITRQIVVAIQEHSIFSALDTVSNPQSWYPDLYAYAHSILLIFGVWWSWSRVWYILPCCPCISHPNVLIFNQEKDFWMREALKVVADAKERAIEALILQQRVIVLLPTQLEDVQFEGNLKAMPGINS